MKNRGSVDPRFFLATKASYFFFATFLAGFFAAFLAGFFAAFFAGFFAVAIVILLSSLVSQPSNTVRTKHLAFYLILGGGSDFNF